MAEGSTARVLVVDDDPSVTSVLRRGLAHEGYTVQTASSGQEALEDARERPPDIVILDIMMPGIDGLEVCERLRRGDQSLPIIFLTARDAPSDQVRGLDRGADDYVTKPFAFDVLLARIRVQLRRHDGNQQGPMVYTDLQVDPLGRLATRDGRKLQLTTTEFDLLRLLLAHQGQVLTKEQIIERIWGYDFDGTGNIVEVYVRSLRRKLEEQGKPRLIQTVRGAGYALREE